MFVQTQINTAVAIAARFDGKECGKFETPLYSVEWDRQGGAIHLTIWDKEAQKCLHAVEAAREGMHITFHLVVEETHVTSATYALVVRVGRTAQVRTYCRQTDRRLSWVEGATYVVPTGASVRPGHVANCFCL